MNIINIILILILISLNFQYYTLNEESKILKETILELKDQNQTLSNEINKMSIINANTSYTTNSTLNSILYFGGLILVTGIAFYFLNGYLFDTNTQSLEASKIINQTTSDYTNNLMNQIHSQNLSQINWLDKKFDSLVTMIYKANIFNNQWFIENVMPNLNQTNTVNTLTSNPSIQQISKIGNLISNSVADTGDRIQGPDIDINCLDQIKNIPNPESLQNMIGIKTNLINSLKVLQSGIIENIEKEKGCVTQNDVLRAMEKTLETAEWI